MVEISPFSALSNIGQAANDRVSIADNFDTFLTLLTTQLKNQNPLDPLDMNQFTQQLVQFTQVEQSVKQNENLERVVQLAAANTITSAVGYIGKEVTTSGASAQYQNGHASWTVTLGADSPSTTFTVKNENGVPVYTQTGPVAGGSSVFTWDGQTDTGVIPAEGTYSLSIVADDGHGGTIASSTAASGIVDGVDMSGDEPVLLVGGWQVRLEDIQSINAPATSNP
jgi:flagellar basal-body rod modification protein FlgD